MSDKLPATQRLPLPPLDIAESSGQRAATTDAPVLLPIRPLGRVRVLHVINGEHYSGAERVQDLLALRLPDEQFAADFVALKPGRFAEVRQSKSRLTQLPMLGRIDCRVVGNLKQLVRQHQYQLLHAHTPRTAIVTAIAARSLRMPWIYHVHSPVSRDSARTWQNRINSWVEGVSLTSAAAVIVVSPSLLPYMRDRGVSDDRLVCVPNGVPADSFPRQIRRPTDELTMGMVALFRPRKGTEVLLEALANVLSRGHRVRLRAIGGFESETYEQQIRGIAAQLGLASQVDFTGFTTNVTRELAELDVLMLPSLYGEGLPMVVLEAMASGVPVIASRVEGVSTVVEHRQSGLLVEPGSVSQLADAIEEFATGAVNLEPLAANARRRHAEQFSDIAMARGVAAVYRDVLEARR
jgi:glycosyltransferase involved in cell wall biosynthesis